MKLIRNLRFIYRLATHNRKNPDHQLNWLRNGVVACMDCRWRTRGPEWRMTKGNITATIFAAVVFVATVVALFVMGIR